MPYKQVWVKPRRVLRCRWINVYAVYVDDDVDAGERWYRFTVSPQAADYDDTGAFDVMDLPQWKALPNLQYERNRAVLGDQATIIKVIRAAILAGDITKDGLKEFQSDNINQPDHGPDTIKPAGQQPALRREDGLRPH